MKMYYLPLSFLVLESLYTKLTGKYPQVILHDNNLVYYTLNPNFFGERRSGEKNKVLSQLTN